MNHLLIVDDSLADRRLAGGLLERQTHHVVEYASSGIEALEQLEERLPLAIITDMQMPEMNGLALVEAVRRQYPQVPVILMTGYGSEEIALQALLAGAADFVSKDRLAQDLARSVASVLNCAGADRGHARISHCLRYDQRRYELDNDVLLIPPLVSQLQHIAADLGVVDPTDGVRLAKALVEGIRNAIYHGNLELPPERVTAAEASESSADAEMVAERRRKLPYADRRVHVEATFSPAEARIIIRDEGPGFDTSRIPDVRQAPANLIRGDGRGLVLIRAFMDEVLFNESGSQITLVKRAPSRAAT